MCVCAYDAKHKKTPDIQTLLPLVSLFFSYESCIKKVVDVGCLKSRTVLELNELCFVVGFCILRNKFKSFKSIIPCCFVRLETVLSLVWFVVF